MNSYFLTEPPKNFTTLIVYQIVIISAIRACPAKLAKNCIVRNLMLRLFYCLSRIFPYLFFKYLNRN